MNIARIFSLVVLTFASAARAQLQYTPLPTPCRAVDTRATGEPVAADTAQTFNPAGGACIIPSQGTGAIAYSMNVTVVPHGPLGYLTVWPTGEPQPVVSTLNSQDGSVKADAAIVAGGSGGDISVYASNTTDLVLDVSGYFTSSSGLVYVPVTPCRLIDTRQATGEFGGPSLAGGQQRTFVLANSSCNLPSSLAAGGALSINVTAVPKASPVGYVTVWGTSQTEPETPLISTLNVPTGTVTANAAIVAINPSTSESISAYTSDDTDLVVDITGYFAPQSTGLSLYTLTPCRVLDTRESSGPFQGELTIPVTTGNNCNVPSTAQAFVTNATVVPSGPLDYLTLWPDQTAQPVVSTLNALDGAVTSNMAIVSSTNSSIDAFASSPTQLILDVSSYFAMAPNNSPTVEFVGDDISMGLVAYANNPNWRCDDCASGATSGQILAGLPLAIAKHPDLVHILAGSYDMYQLTWIDACDPNEGDGSSVNTCANIQAIMSQLDAAHIPWTAGNLPEWQPGTLSNQLASADGSVGWVQDNEDLFNRDFGSDFNGAGSFYAVNYYAALLPQYISANGIDPNSAGYGVMLPLAEAAIAQVAPGVAQGAKKAHASMQSTSPSLR